MSFTMGPCRWAGLKTKPEYKGLAEAVSLGIAVLIKAKQNT
ncbi:hypothetical protein [Arthrobacter globiformis]|nr:hypothetical protein [Arthrobacter globiformis]